MRHLVKSLLFVILMGWVLPVFAWPSFLLLPRPMDDEGIMDWKIGDSLNYDVTVLPVQYHTTMSLSVTQVTRQTVTLQQVMQLVPGAGLTTQMIMDRATGQLLKLIVNGHEQDGSSATGGGMEIVQQREAQVTVPAGTFKCVMTVMQSDDGVRSSMCVNREVLPLMGLVESRTPMSMLTLDSKLKSFHKAP